MYYVWNEDGRRPTYRHLTLEGARTEAQRLAAANPGHKFFVLFAVGYSIKKEAEWHDANEADLDSIPF